MLPVIDQLNEISVEELQEALDNVDGNKPTQRLLAAIAYKNGVTQTELAEWYDTERKTIYNWLNRFDTDEPLEQAVTDAHRSGRKRKISENSKKSLNKQSTNHPKRSALTRRRGRRRSHKNILKKCTASTTQSQAAGGC